MPHTAAGLTGNERRVLEALVSGEQLSAYQLIDQDQLRGRSAESVARTADSTARKGLVTREWTGGRIRYQITGKGREALNERPAG